MDGAGGPVQITSMTVLFIIFPLALLIAAGAVIAYIWAARTGQFDDLDTPPVRMLHDDVSPVTRRRTPDANEPEAVRANERESSSRDDIEESEQT